MGSKKKKQEKKKDFVKPKLKVGKTAPKASNATDTSFKSKTINLPTQLKLDKDLEHYLSLTKHHSSTTRKEVLAHIEKHLPNNPSLYKQIIMSVIPLMADESNGVRTALLSLLTKCSEKQSGLLELHSKSLVLFIHSSMTNINKEVRNFAPKYLQLLLNVCPEIINKLYFIKTLKCFFNLLNWPLDDNKKIPNQMSPKQISNHLTVLNHFLSISLSETPQVDNVDNSRWHPLTYKYLLPTVPQPFNGLKLFINELPKSSYILNDIDNISTNDLAVRKKIFHDIFLNKINFQLRHLATESGEVSKEAKNLINLLDKLYL